MLDISAFLYKYNLHLIKIEDINNISVFIIASLCFLLCLYYNLIHSWYENNNNMNKNLTKLFDLLIPVVGLHAAWDFFLTKSYDLKIHHLCIFGIIFCNCYYNVSIEYRFIFLYPLLKTEISSFFYVLKYWIPKETILYNVNIILFYISFLKLRIYDFYYEIIYNNISFNIVFDKYSQSNYYLSYIFLISCYGLYILNLYWFLIMNKIIYKTISKIVNINTDILCHFLCSYLHFINIPLSCYIYAYNPNEKYIFDMIGITALSITSYKYHNDIYSRLYNNQIVDYILPNKDNIIIFMNDIIAINIRSFLVIVTNYYYYNTEQLLISSIFHIFTIYHYILNILNLFIDNNKNKETFLICHNILSGISIACDIFLILINSQTEIFIPFLLLNIIICLLYVVKPFYKLTHAAFHILLIIQNYYICLLNRK